MQITCLCAPPNMLEFKSDEWLTVSFGIPLFLGLRWGVLDVLDVLSAACRRTHMRRIVPPFEWSTCKWPSLGTNWMVTRSLQRLICRSLVLDFTKLGLFSRDFVVSRQKTPYIYILFYICSHSMLYCCFWGMFFILKHLSILAIPYSHLQLVSLPYMHSKMINAWNKISRRQKCINKPLQDSACWYHSEKQRSSCKWSGVYCEAAFNF